MVQRLRRCPVVAEIRVRFPLVTPISPYRSGLPTDKIAGYEPANEGSIPSPNTTFEPKKESYYATKPSRSHLARFPRPPARPFYQDIAQPGRARARGARGHGIEARFLTIYADVLLRLATPSPTSCPVMGRQDPRLPRANASR